MFAGLPLRRSLRRQRHHSVGLTYGLTNCGAISDGAAPLELACPVKALPQVLYPTRHAGGHEERRTVTA
jgi:hypothetical protein